MLDQQQAIHDRLDEVEQKLAAFVGFDDGHKPLAGCFVSIGQDGTPFLDKGLVKPEHTQATGQAAQDGWQRRRTGQGEAETRPAGIAAPRPCR